MEAAEKVLISENVFTGTNDEARPLALGINQDVICWTCAPDEVGSASAPLSSGAAVHDLGDGFIMAGFHDAHLHFFHGALYASPLADRFVGTSEADCVARLIPLAARRPEGSWLLAQGWREALWDDPHLPSKRSLDAAYPDRPVALYSGDAHTLWLNSCALDELGLTPQSVPPSGGAYDKDEEGNLTGIVRETAAMELMPRIMATFTDEELLDAYESFLQHLNAHGVTAVCDMALAATPGLDFVRDDLFERLLQEGKLTVRAHLFPTLLSKGARLAEMQQRLFHPLLQARGYKQFFDGVSSQHTAWLHDPYANARTPDDRGRPTVQPQKMASLVHEAVAQGQSVRIHAIGDEAIHQALGIYEEALHAQPGEGHTVLTLEHLENFQAQDIARLARAGVIASVQPRHITLDPGGPERDLGEERARLMWPFRSLLDAGAHLAFGTDAPVTDIPPLAAIYTAITRKDADTRLPEDGWLPQERITVAEALRAYTQGSARAAGRAQELGTLEPGQLADITVLGADPLTADPEVLPGIPVLATIVGGRCVFSNDARLPCDS